MWWNFNRIFYFTNSILWNDIYLFSLVAFDDCVSALFSQTRRDLGINLEHNFGGKL